MKILQVITLLLGSVALSATQNIRYTKSESPCAIDRSSRGLLAEALINRDAEAVRGLIERGKVLVLSTRTKFDQEDAREGFSWGFVRSGRHIGESCYVPTQSLQDSPPN